MVSTEHESFADTVRDRPEFAVELLRELFGVTIPNQHATRLESVDFSQSTPTEFRADAAVSVWVAGEPSLAAAYEVQRDYREEKVQAWKVYVAALSARLGCRVALVVICTSTSVADRYRQPIPLGYPACAIQPLVLGPDEIPVIAEPLLAHRTPELAVLGAIVHSRGRHWRQVLVAFLVSLSTFSEDRQMQYYGLVFQDLTEQKKRWLEHTMRMTEDIRDHPFVRVWLNAGQAEGRAEGEATALLVVLGGMGIEVPDDARERILACTDREEIEGWLRRVGTAKTIEDILSD